jgi:hypothetical protein
MREPWKQKPDFIPSAVTYTLAFIVSTTSKVSNQGFFSKVMFMFNIGYFKNMRLYS